MTTGNPLFVIVIPTWNRAALLESVYRQIAAQSHARWKLLLWDDCSSDNTSEVVASLADADPRVIYRQASENSGCNASRNALLDWARQDYPDGWMVMLDDDDVLLEGALERLATLIQSNPDCSWFATTCQSNDASKPSLCRKTGNLDYLNDYMFGNTIKGDLLHCIALSAIDNENFTNRFRSGEEWYFFSLLARRISFFVSDQPAAAKNYQQGGLSASGINRDRKREVLEWKLEVLEPIVGARRLRHQYVSLASIYIKEERLPEAKLLLDKVRQSSPFYLRQYRHRLKLKFAR